MTRLGGQFGPDVTFLGVPRCDLDDPASYAEWLAVARPVISRLLDARQGAVA